MLLAGLTKCDCRDEASSSEQPPQKLLDAACMCNILYWAAAHLATTDFTQGKFSDRSKGLTFGRPAQSLLDALDFCNLGSERCHDVALCNQC